MGMIRCFRSKKCEIVGIEGVRGLRQEKGKNVRF